MKHILNILSLILAASSCIRPSGTDKTSSLNTEPCLAPVALDDNASRIATAPMDCQLDSNGKRTGYWPYSYLGRLDRRAYYKEGLLNGEYYDRYYLFYDSEIFGHYKNGEIDGKWIMNYKQETDVLNNYCPVMVELYDFTVKSKTQNNIIYHCKIKDYYSDGTIIDRERDISNFIRDEDSKRHHFMIICNNEFDIEYD